ncbi:PREDICTED: protein MEF2BNB, partial [Acanthisitta chloris]|uniref:protein MEF2BNB n=1 Tax=Acanthisitta chloris TaxID=57068 RepID=UPI0004F0ED76
VKTPKPRAFLSAILSVRVGCALNPLEIPTPSPSTLLFASCSAIKNMTDSSVYFKSIDSLLKHAIAMKDQLNAAQGRR